MYDPFAAEYAAHAEGSAHNALYDRPAVLALAGEVAGLDVLDAGCGPGLYAEELLRRGARVVGFDASAELVAVARRRLGDRAELRVHDLAAPLGWLAGGSFDVAVCALVLNYLDERVGALRELRRVLRPQGALVVSTTHPMHDWQRLGGSYFAVAPVEESLHPDRDWPVRAWRRPLTAVCEEFHAAGFVIERLVEPRPSPEMAERFPEHHARLERSPAFVAFRLIPR
jgi:SAM-dependent methyltransferase